MRSSASLLALGGALAVHCTAAVHVSGNKLVDDNGHIVHLRGASHSGSEYSCVQGHGVLEGETDAAAITAMKDWGINIVRVPLNEDCWLGINGVQPSMGGDAYQQAIKGYVDGLLAQDMVVILDLHWTAPGSTLATKQERLPDTDHSPTFWTQVAQAYNYSQDVVFEVFNEPFLQSTGADDAPEWKCWAQGGSACTSAMGTDFSVAGMAQLVGAIRDAGATNVLLLGALQWSNNLDHWLDYYPSDPLNNTAAVWHSYDFNACNNEACWNATIAKVADVVPVVVTECGFKIDYAQKLWPWVEAQGIHYLAWVWNTWGNDQALVSSYDGTPTQGWGTAYKTWLGNLPKPSPAPAPSSPAPSPAKPAPSPAKPSPSAKPGPSPSPSSTGCPGGTMTKCLDLCPASPPTAFKACAAQCAQRCTKV